MIIANWVPRALLVLYDVISHNQGNKTRTFLVFESRNKLIKVDNSAAILFCNKVRCVWRRLTYRGILLG